MKRSIRARWRRIVLTWAGLVGLLVLITAFWSGFAHAEDGVRYEDLSVPVQTIILESGGEGFEGMIAVANVIRNRAKARNMTYTAVCLQKWQFSCWNGSKARGGAFIRKNRGVWRDALDAWQVSESEDITGGADHYHTKSVNPSWNRGMVQTVVIGNHRFYKSK